MGKRLTGISIKSRSPGDVVKEYQSNIRIMQWNKTHNNRNGQIHAWKKCDIGSHIGEKIFIPRLSLTPSDHRIPFPYSMRQFWLALSFSLTINKSEGQSLKNVGIYLLSPDFHMVNYMLLFEELLQEITWRY